MGIPFLIEVELLVLVLVVDDRDSVGSCGQVFEYGYGGEGLRINFNDPGVDDSVVVGAQSEANVAIGIANARDLDGQLAGFRCLRG